MHRPLVQRPIGSGTRPTSATISVPNISMEDRRGFNVRSFIKQHGLNPALGGGTHMFREVWDDWVSKVIYPKVLRTSHFSFISLFIFTHLFCRRAGTGVWSSETGERLQRGQVVWIVKIFPDSKGGRSGPPGTSDPLVEVLYIRY